ncbi:MAG TPA: hypothetical protein PKB03_06635, partial [Baekduia sp.]|nr:hypothetical protein [Baekduia sp.]
SIWNPRFGTYENQTQAQSNKGVLPPSPDRRLVDPDFVNRPHYWLDEARTTATWNGDLDWALCWRDIGPKERTFMASVAPRWAAGHTLPLGHLTPEYRSLGACFVAAWSSLAVDFALRSRSEKGRMSYFIVKQMPMPAPAAFAASTPWEPDQALVEWITPRALELTYTARYLEPFARDVGYDGAPYQWIPDRRLILQAELDACFLHVYGLDRSHAEHVLDSFVLLSQNETKEHGEYLTKRLVLERYDAMAEATESGRPYKTPLDPPPGDASIAHAQALAR